RGGAVHTADARSLDPRDPLAVVAFDLEHPGRDEPRSAVDLGFVRNALHAIEHEPDETVTFAPDAIHDRSSVDLDRRVYPERTGVACVVSGVARGDEELARHAADA